MKRVLMALLALAFVACGQQSKVDMQQKYEDRLVRLSKIEVYEEYLDEYLSFVGEVGRASVEQEEGVLTLFSVQEKERLPYYHPRDLCLSCGLRAPYHNAPFSEIQAGYAAYGQVARTM